MRVPRLIRAGIPALGLALACLLSARPGEAASLRADRVLVRVAPGRSLPAALSAPGARHLFENWWRIPVASGETAVALRASLESSAAFDRVESDVVQHLAFGGADLLSEPPPSTPRSAELISNDPLLVQQWHHRAIGAEAAWLRSTGEGVVVAVIDSGVKSGGNDGFCRPLAGEYDAVLDVEGPGVAVDHLGHGTFVAGVVAECTGNGTGGAGLAPGASILAIRGCTDDSECTSSEVAAAIDWATTHGARIINLSLGMACGSTDWPECSTAVENDAIARAVDAGVVVVAIAGNGHEDHLGFPANHPEVIGVGGVEARLLKTSYSSWGTALSVMAPAGEPIVDTDGDGFDDQILQETLRRVCVPLVTSGFAYCRWSGTSFAAPHVAAAVALLLEEHPDATRQQVRQALEESALDRGAPGFDALYGHGVVQADRALGRLDEIVAAGGEGCVATPQRLCLLQDRFAVEVTWTNYQGISGTGTVHPLTTDSGLFWFFAPANLEMLVKMVDGCSFNGHTWVYAAATTDVEYHLRVTESASGAFRTFDNTLGTASPAFTSIDAFPCDD
ncbi:MAG: S8 family serine peptidase [Thermoanaerobaculia bacterium]